MPKDKTEPPPDADDPEQSRRFIDMAREVGADENADAFEKAFLNVTRPPDHPNAGAPKKPHR